MRTRRPISINNSLAHGICNYSCRLCAVNKPNYRGPREFQTLSVTKRLISRVREAATEGLRIRYIGNAGDGEPTLHPGFGRHMDLFGEMIRSWDIPGTVPPEVSVVTNGARLLETGMMDAFLRNPLTLIVSLPTSRPEAYGEVMVGDAQRGGALLSQVLSGVEHAMRLRAAGRLQRLQFHIAPPERDIVRRDFPDTVECLTSLAATAGMKQLDLICFPATSNRSGLVRNSVKGCDMYGDLFRKHNGKTIHGVRVVMSLSFRRFMPSLGEFVDLIRGYNYPCVWNSQLFVTADGTSICCNDQAVRNPMGSIMTDSLCELVERKENHMPGTVCAACDQRPGRLAGSAGASIFGWLACARLALARRSHVTRLSREVIRRQQPDGKVPGGTMKRFRSLKSETCRGSTAGLAASVASADAVSGEGPMKTSGSDALRGDEAIEVKLSETIPEMTAAFRIVYEKYLLHGYQKPNKSGIRVNLFNLLPSSFTLVGKCGDETMATITAVCDSAAGLPMDSLYKNELDKLRSGDRRLVELSGLAVDDSVPQRSRRLVEALFRSAFILCYDILNATDFCITVNPAHEAYYRRILGFEKIGDTRKYETVNGAEAVPLRRDLHDMEERTRRTYSPTLHRFFFAEPRRTVIRQLLLQSLPRRQRLFCGEYLEFVHRNSNVLDSLDARERMIVEDYYSEAWAAICRQGEGALADAASA